MIELSHEPGRFKHNKSSIVLSCVVILRDLRFVYRKVVPVFVGSWGMKRGTIGRAPRDQSLSTSYRNGKAHDNN